MKTLEYFSSSVDDTYAFADQCARHLPVGVTLALHGDLGAGKSVFARGFARALGITENVCSPTFTIMQPYSFGDNKILAHFDLYRLSDYYGALDFGMDEYLNDPDVTALIEWSERAPELLPSTTAHLYLNRVGDVVQSDGNEKRHIRLILPALLEHTF